LSIGYIKFVKDFSTLSTKKRLVSFKAGRILENVKYYILEDIEFNPVCVIKIAIEEYLVIPEGYIGIKKSHGKK